MMSSLEFSFVFKPHKLLKIALKNKSIYPFLVSFSWEEREEKAE